MGGGKSQSQQQTDQSTKVTTTTSTTIGDIGLTGKDAVALAQVIGNTSTANLDAAATAVAPLADIFAQGFNRVTDAATKIASVDKTPTQTLAENAPLIVAGLGAALFLLRKG